MVFAVNVASSDESGKRLEVPGDEVKDTHLVLTRTDLTSSDYPGSWPLLGSDYRMKIGRYMLVDALEDFYGTGDKYQFLYGRSSYFNMFVKETRFNFDMHKSEADEPSQLGFNMSGF